MRLWGRSAFQRYTDDAKRAIYFAHIEAVHRKQHSISVADLLVGITYNGESRASKIAHLKHKAVMLRSVVGIPHLPITSLAYQRGADIPLDDDAKKAVAYATEEANLDSQFWIDSDHLLRALMRFPNEAGEALLQANIDLGLLRSASAQDRSEAPAAPAPKWPDVKNIVRTYWAVALIAAILLIIFAYIQSQR